MTRLEAFESLATHPYYASSVKKLTEVERLTIRAICHDNDHMDVNAFSLMVRDLLVDKKIGSRADDILIAINQIARGVK